MQTSTSKHVAIYVRVSTDMQVDADSLPMQRQTLTGYAQYALGADADHIQIYEDAGFSGKDFRRPAFQDMMTAARAGHVSHVLVWKIDRISRNLLDFMTLYEELKKLDVVFISKNEQFDTSNAMGEAMLQILLVFAQLERAMTAERVRATMINRAANGIWNGGWVPYGYTYDSTTGTFSVDPVEAATVCMLFDSYLVLPALSDVVERMAKLGVTRRGVPWTEQSIWNTLKNIWYTGDYHYNKHKGTIGRKANPEKEWVTYENHHPAIITKELYAEVQKKMEANCRLDKGKKYNSNQWSDHIFRSLIYCAECGDKMQGTANRANKDEYRSIVYHCRTAKKHLCPSGSAMEAKIGDMVLNTLSNLLHAKENFSAIRQGGTDKLTQALTQGRAFHTVESLTPGSVSGIYDTLSKFKSDSSYKTTAPIGRQEVKLNATLAELRKERRTEQTALDRLENSYLYRKRAMPEEEYVRRKDEITKRLEELDRRIGLVRDTAPEIGSTERMFEALRNLFNKPGLAGADEVDYKKLAVQENHAEIRDALEKIINAVMVKDGYVIKIIFVDGTEIKYVYDPVIVRKMEKKRESRTA